MIGETKLKILIAALTPSRYTDLARASGVSKTMFDRHLDDLLEEGLIEKTEEGLYVITTKGLELLLKLKAAEQESLVERIRTPLLFRKKVPEEIKHCWLEIGRLYAEYLLQIKELTMIQTDLSNLVDREDYPAFVTNLESLVGASYSLGIYIIGRLRDYVGKFMNPVADILRRLITFKPEVPLVVPPDFLQTTLDVAEKKLGLVLSEVEKLSLLSGNDRELRLAASYLELKLEDIRTYLTKAKGYLIKRKLSEQTER